MSYKESLRGPRCGRFSILSRVPSRSAPWHWIAATLFVLLSLISFARIYHLSTGSLLHKTKHPTSPSEPPPPWEQFEPLDRYWGGIRTLEPATHRLREYPHQGEHPKLKVNVSKEAAHSASLPAPIIYDPLGVHAVPAQLAQYMQVEPCYLDAKDTIPLPRLQAYRGLPKGFPKPISGSYGKLNLSDGLCFERYGRLGPYGYGYSKWRGGIGGGWSGDREGVEKLWQAIDQIDYNKVQWGDAQEWCYQKNRHRFDSDSSTIKEKWEDMRARPGNVINPLRGRDGSATKLPRTAIVLRVWGDFKWTDEAILRMRSLITELSLLSGGEYQVHFLVHIRDEQLPIWDSEEVYTKALQRALPREFARMGVLWSEPQMRLFYPDLEETNAAGRPVHGVYRSAHFPLQYFAQIHPEYDYFWNWEMDIRYTGHWYTLFESLRSFAREQPRKGLWERNARFYVPTVHGSWEDFVRLVLSQSEKASLDDPAGVSQPVTEPHIWGPQAPAGSATLSSDPVPPRSYAEDNYEWGVGEEADLITLNPIFNPENTRWVLNGDVTGYTKDKPPPRRAAIVTASRLSRRLLTTMHTETALHKHTMFTEMWAATIALHHGLKAVYAPHPVYEDRAWPPDHWEKKFNGGLNGASGGAMSSLFGIELDRNFYGTTWYFHAKLSGNLWRRWLGLRDKGSEGAQDELHGEGRMCLPPVLLHPVKSIDEGFPV